MTYAARVLPLAVSLVAAAGARAQDSWPNARCYAMTRGPWRVEGDTVGWRVAPPPAVPDLLILEDTAADPLIWFRARDEADTGRHVVHGRSGDARWSDAGWDRSFVFWHRPTRDGVVVVFGTGYGGVDFDLRFVGDGLRGTVGTHSDTNEPLWRAAATGRRVRCPAPPTRLRLGILRLAVTDTTYPSERLPSIRVSLTSAMHLDCPGERINYEAIISPDTVGVVVLGPYAAPRPCTPGRGPANAAISLGGAPRRTTLLIRHEGVTNRFALTVTDSSLALASELATTVIADEQLRPRMRHNLFVITCGHLAARTLCNDIGDWLLRQPGLTRLGEALVTTAPYTEQLNEDVRLAVFRYDGPAALGRVRACMVSIAEQVRATDRVYVTIRTWLGEELQAWAERGRLGSPAPAPVPAGLTQAPGCAG